MRRHNDYFFFFVSRSSRAPGWRSERARNEEENEKWKGGLARRVEARLGAALYEFFKKEIIKERTGNERGGNKEESLRDTRPPRLRVSNGRSRRGLP